MTHEFQFENEHVSVWKTKISPDQPYICQKNDSRRVIVNLNGSAHWDSPDLNLGDEPVEVMIVEMKKPKDHPLPPKPLD